MRVTFSSLTEVASGSWDSVRQMLCDDLRRLQATINKTWDVAHHADGTQRTGTDGILLGQISGTLAEQPSGLTVDNDGLLYFVTDYGHLVRWDGSAGVWRFAPGDDGPGYIQGFAVVPQATGWVLCDGGATTYLVAGSATLTTANFTTPNLTGTPSYLKLGAAYSGSGAAAGSTSSDGGHTHSVSGSTANESAHTHDVNPAIDSTNADNGTTEVQAGVGATVAAASHNHTYDVPNTTSSAGTAHNHGAGTLATGSDGSHTHSLSGVELQRVTVLPYFRR
jgi:hypothetical protein